MFIYSPVYLAIHLLETPSQYVKPMITDMVRQMHTEALAAQRTDDSRQGIQGHDFLVEDYAKLTNFCCPFAG